MQNSGTGVHLNDIVFVNDITGYAAGNSGIILKTTDGGNPVGIRPVSNEIPNQFSLSQNYPNPFNPTTSFQFAVSCLSFVKIVVYDVMGRGVQSLVNEQLQPGTYEADFDGSNFASGVYYYKLTAGDFMETRKMVLIK